jgi:LmbE family N-acetylglucosaminyl deacetylase
VATVFFHAHPDDEAIFTAGTMAALVAAGERVALVLATAGELGVEPTDLTEPLADIRRREVRAAASALGVDEVAFLGYRDSGMHGDAANGHDEAFCAAPIDAAAARLARILRAFEAETLVVYDERGVYGHPDHVQVHLVGHRAARLAGVDTIYESTFDGEYLHFVEEHLLDGARHPSAGRRSVGVPSVFISVALDVRPHLGVKRQALAAHRSQIAETAWALRMPESTFADVYGYEFYMRSGPPSSIDRLGT